MKTRVILFTRVKSDDPEAAVQFLFARWGHSLELELPAQMGVEDFAQKLNFKRHSKFDYAVGEMGRKATLLECVEGKQLKALSLDDQRQFPISWDLFRQTAQALKDGTDRRFLQLAVQFLASGESIDESVIAADYDAEFIQGLQKTLSEKNSGN